MRIEQLELLAVGPFTNRTLAFPAPDPSGEGTDLHVVYGPNEAGKSSCLRALRALLFGFPTRATEAWMHAPPSLRVGGEISVAGRRQRIIRRRGRTNTLVDQDGLPIDEGLLAEVNGGVQGEYFDAVFGLDRQELEAGSAEILVGRGDLGEALFSASLGGGRIHLALDRLESEAQRLFRGRARRDVRIPEQLDELRELKRRASELRLAPAAWVAARDAATVATANAEERRRELRELRARKAWVDRVVASFPLVAERRAVREHLAELHGFPEDLAEDFGARVNRCLDDLHAVREAERLLSETIRNLESRITPIRVDSPLVEAGPGIERLARRWENHLERASEAGVLERETAEIRGEVKAGLAALGQGSAGDPADGGFRERLLAELRLDPKAHAAMTDLARKEQGVVREVELAREALESADSAIEGSARQIEALAGTEDVGHLGAVLEAMSEAAARFARIPDLEEEIRTKEVRARGLAARLPGGEGVGLSFRQVAGRPLPPESAVVRLADRGREIEERMNRLREDLLEEQKRRRDQTARVEELVRKAGGEAGIERLLVLRDERDRQWARTERARRAVDEEWSPVAQAFGDAVKSVDQEADRLIREADVVAQAGEARRQIARADARIADLEREQHAAAGEEGELIQSWQRLWAGTFGAEPIVRPVEVLPWLGTWKSLAETVDELDILEARCSALRDERTREIRNLRKHLAPCPDNDEETFEILLAMLRRRVEDARDRRTRADEIRERLESVREQRTRLIERLARAETARDEWRSRWNAVLTTLGLGSQLDSSSADAELQRRSRLAEHLKRLEQREAALAALRDEAREIRADVLALARRLRPEHADEDEADTSLLVDGLLDRLTTARADQRTLTDLQAQRDEQSGKADANRARLESLLRKQDDLCREGGCKAPEELRARAEAARRRRELLTRDSQIEAQLAALSAGESADAWAVAVEQHAEAADRLRAESADLEDRVESIERAYETLLREEGEAGERLRVMDGGAAFAEAREAVASTEAGIRADVERFVRLRAAIRVLRSAIDTFREKNQAPLLGEAGRLFAALTLGSFSGIRAEYDATDRPVVAGARPGGEGVPVDGLSEGTRDQLYLALRLAALRRHLDHRPALPLVIDDLFVTFDDERAGALTRILAEIASRTQVIVFTHHRHLVELMREVIAAPLNVVEL